MKKTDISKADCTTITKKIRENIFTPASTFKTTIFLCGADINDKKTTRHKIAEVLKTRFVYSMYYDLIYPEDIFDELLYTPNSTDLLSLENLLADSVDAVIIVPESPGSFAELGAFANNEKLRNKLVCVVDEKFKRDKSFINQGPLKLVKDVNKDAVVFIDPKQIEKNDSKTNSLYFLLPHAEIDKILAPVKKLKKSGGKIENKITLLQLDRFLLPAIFLLEPVKKDILNNLVANAIEEIKFSSSSTATALLMLTKKKFIELTVDGYKLTELGTNEFLSFRKKKNRYKEQDKTVAIDDLRLEILNLQNRKKKLKV